MKVLKIPAEMPLEDYKPEVLEITGDLDSMKDIVGGWIEIVHPAGEFHPHQRMDGVVMVVNDEGLLHNLPINRHASVIYGVLDHGHWIHGDVFLCGMEMGPEGADLASYPHEGTER